MAQAFGIVGVLANRLTRVGLSEEPTALPTVTGSTTSLGATGAAHQNVKAIRVPAKPSRVAPIAGSVRRVSAPAATPSANAKPA